LKLGTAKKAEVRDSQKAEEKNYRKAEVRDCQKAKGKGLLKS
jgi:hypothetical protein